MASTAVGEPAFRALPVYSRNIAFVADRFRSEASAFFGGRIMKSLSVRVFRLPAITAQVVFVGSLGLALSAMGLPVSDVFRYDGTYMPNSGSPPAGQSTWNQYIGTGASITPNAPSAGVATLDDTSTGGGHRVAINKTYSDPVFIANPADTTWEYATRLQIDNYTGSSNANYFGFFRDFRG
jgi:hypothetical protein